MIRLAAANMVLTNLVLGSQEMKTSFLDSFLHCSIELLTVSRKKVKWPLGS